MEFKNSIPDTPSNPPDPNLPPYSASNSPPQYTSQPSTTTTTATTPSRGRWSVHRVWLYDLVLHLLSILFAVPVIALYITDISLAHNQNARPPWRLLVIDVLGVVSAAYACTWSKVYLLVFSKRAKRERLPRRNSTLIDLSIWVFVLAIADTTLSVRTGNASCRRFGGVGGCESWRRSIMVAVGVLGICLS